MKHIIHHLLLLYFNTSTFKGLATLQRQVMPNELGMILAGKTVASAARSGGNRAARHACKIF